MSCRIGRIEYYLPEKILTNDELGNIFPEYANGKIGRKLGIEVRHVAGEGETALDMGIKAASQALEGYDRNKIDFLLFCTQSPDYCLPTSACIAQEKLGLSTKCGALDFNLGCSGYIYGLAMAKGLINAKIASCVLLITAETYTKHIHPNDKSNRAIFGDAAAATIIESSQEENIFNFALGTDGKGAENLIVRNGMLRQSKNDTADDFLYMNGPEIFNFTIAAVPELVNDVLEKNSNSLNDIDFFIFHQANKYMLEYLRLKIDIPESKFYINMVDTGNTVSSTIPIALSAAMSSKKITSGAKILLVGFGVGYSFGAVIIRIV